jgi:hypothetical protein
MSAGSPAVQAAALIRAGIRAAVEDGSLGLLPPGISFSVRASNFATAPGVTVTVYGAPGEWAFTGPQREALTPECDALRRKLLAIAGRHWQPDVPGGFTDVQVIGRRDFLDLIDAEIAQITPAEIEERLTQTLRRAGYAHGDIPGHPKRKD